MREPRYPLPRVVSVSKAARVPPRAPRTGRGGQRAVGSVFLGAFRAGVRWSPDERAGARRGRAGDARTGAEAPRPRESPGVRTCSRVVLLPRLRQ